MTIRQEYEKLEFKILSKFATKSAKSKGREIFEEKCEIRTEFQRDKDRILHSKAFRRLKHKTQVFISPIKDHYRTRLTHTLEVAQIGRTIARALRLNEDLVEAASFAHDIGHTPYGHTGEKVLNNINPNGFKHNIQSLRILDFLEHSKSRYGLNLTYEIRDAVVNHSGDNIASTLEGKILKFADRIAYINHDIDDAIRSGIFFEKDIPIEISNILGNSKSERITTLVKDIIENSMNKNDIIMSKSVYNQMMDLRKFMFKNVYHSDIVTAENEKIFFIIEKVYKYFKKNFDKLPQDHLAIYKNTNIKATKDDVICDYIASMTDIYMKNMFREIFIPKSWSL